MENQRLCWDCKSCVVDYQGDHSAYTPGTGLEMNCGKGHWDLDRDIRNNNLGPEDLKRVFRLAVLCSDFKSRE